MSQIHKNKWNNQRESFNHVAADYESYRPGYPKIMLDTLIEKTGLTTYSALLEVGSGTGKGTEQFANNGFSVHCIEPGGKLIDQARRKFSSLPGITFEETTFEDWQPDRQYDLIFSAQAWHWIPAEIRFSKPAEILKPGGYLALIWNQFPYPDDLVTQKLDEIYQRVAPSLAANKHDFQEHMHQTNLDFKNSGYFTNITLDQFPWEKTYTADEYTGLLGTHSSHNQLPPETLSALQEAVHQMILDLGGTIKRPYNTVLHMGKKI